MAFRSNVNIDVRANGIERVLAQSDKLLENMNRLNRQKVSLDATAALGTLRVLDTAFKSLSNTKIKLQLDLSRTGGKLSLLDAIKNGVDIKVKATGFEGVNVEINKTMKNIEALTSRVNNFNKSMEEASKRAKILSQFSGATPVQGFTKQQAAEFSRQKLVSAQRAHLENFLADTTFDLLGSQAKRKRISTKS